MFAWPGSFLLSLFSRDIKCNQVVLRPSRTWRRPPTWPALLPPPAAPVERYARPPPPPLSYSTQPLQHPPRRDPPSAWEGTSSERTKLSRYRRATGRRSRQSTEHRPAEGCAPTCAAVATPLCVAITWPSSRQLYWSHWLAACETVEHSPWWWIGFRAISAHPPPGRRTDAVTALLVTVKHALHNTANDCHHQSFSRSFRVHQIRFWPGPCIGPRWQSLQRYPRPCCWFKGDAISTGKGTAPNANSWICPWKACILE